MADFRAPKIVTRDISAWQSVVQTTWGGQVANPDVFDGKPYQLDPVGYIRDKLGWEPWAGIDAEHPGQIEILDAYRLALAKQLEQRAISRGEVIEPQYYVPGETIQFCIRVESANAVGKTKLASGIVNHFYDCFSPSITYCFAPAWTQIHDLLFKEIKATREGKGLPGRILDLRLDRTPEHFVTGKATNDADGAGLARTQGQHSPHILMALDEAEGIPKFVYDGVDTMTSGGIVIVLMLANPESRTSEFYRRRSDKNVKNFRINRLYHPNVFYDKEIVSGAVRRDAVELSIEKHCQVVAVHDPDKFTFEAPWRPGVIYLPDDVFCRTDLGIPPVDGQKRVLIPQGRYEEACKREVFPEPEDMETAWIGIDVARDGADMGTLYCRWALKVWRHAKLSRLDTNQYAGSVKELCAWLKEQGVKNCKVRIDNGGGYGGGVRDRLVEDEDIEAMFEEFDIALVQFVWKAYDERQYGDRITEIYADTAESLKGLRIEDPPSELESDLCDREYKWINRSGRELRVLETKDVFRGRLHRSPDDGDGFVLAVAGDRLVSHVWFWL